MRAHQLSSWIETVRDAGLLGAVMVLLVAGSATAGALVTGKQIASNTIQGRDLRDNSITGIDVHNGSLSGKDFKLRSIRGPQGAAGIDGAEGSQGPQGGNGVPGVRFLSSTQTMISQNFAAMFLKCNPGEQVIAGGAESAVGISVSMSAPRTDTFGTQGWFTYVYSNAPPPFSVNLYGLCVV